MHSLCYIDKIIENEVNHYFPYLTRGRVTQATGTVIKAITNQVSIGEICLLRNLGESQTFRAEIIGFENEIALLMPMDKISGISSSTEVITKGPQHTIGVGYGLRGRVLNALGEPLDIPTKGKFETNTYYPVIADPPDPLSRRMITKPIPLGIKALDSFVTCGEGQRMGIFSAAGVGKSTLQAMMVKSSSADITIVALIGERGREVREFIEQTLGPEGMKKAIVIVATSDRPAIERVKAAYVATAVAEYFRDQGLRVLLLMDSITRFARAQREIGLAAGETPTRRGYPSSVFSAIPRLLERSGNSSQGSITAFYNVLVEGDDMNEPIADEVRSIVDGHIVLSRELSEKSHFPAIDILASLSRTMNKIVTPEHLNAASRLRRLLARYADVEFLVKVGEYKYGVDLESDEAIKKYQTIQNFLQQGIHEHHNAATTIDQLLTLNNHERSAS